MIHAITMSTVKAVDSSSSGFNSNERPFIMPDSAMVNTALMIKNHINRFGNRLLFLKNKISKNIDATSSNTPMIVCTTRILLCTVDKSANTFASGSSVAVDAAILRFSRIPAHDESIVIKLIPAFRIKDAAQIIGKNPPNPFFSFFSAVSVSIYTAFALTPYSFTVDLCNTVPGTWTSFT